jgi:hypothetical protein
MGWSYSGDPKESNLDAVRFLVGDTIESDQLTTDEVIEWALGTVADIYNAAALVANGIATNFARLKISVKIGPIAEDYGDRAKFYASRAQALTALAGSNSAMDISIVSSYSANGILNTGIFDIGMNDILTTLTNIDPTLSDE